MLATISGNGDDDNSDLPPVPTSGPYGAPSVTMSPLAAALSSGGMPGGSLSPPPVSPPAVAPQPAPPPQDQQSPGFLQMLADGLRGFGGPPGGSRVDPSTGQFLSPDQQQQYAQPQPAVANANTLPAPTQVASAGTSDTSAAAAEDPRMAGYRALHDQAVAEFNRNKALAMQAAQAGNSDLSASYVTAAQQYYKLAEDISLKAIETQKPADTSTTEQKNFEYAQTHPGFPVPGAAKPANLELRDIGGGHFVTFNPQTGEIKPGPASTASSSTLMGANGQPVDENLSGPDVLKSVPAPVATMAQRMIDGLQPVPAMSVRTAPVVAQAVLAAQQVDPTLDANESKVRMGTQRDFTSGPTSKVITAGNTALGHLTELNNLVPQLNNYDTQYGGTLLNAGVNAVKGTGAAGAPLARFNELNQLYSAEMEKFYAGSSGGTAGERKQLELNISPNMTPTQQMAAIQTAATALASKVEALNGQWHQGMGPMARDFDVIHPENKAFVAAMRSGPLGTLLPQGSAPASAGLPPVGGSTTINGVTIKRIN
ncbi:MAG: hypothetical protein CR217_06040 [Beijerinckiaceae bacterium]|nr:MAG: hypothetical protein CR217_06040 [Beijerinckiaceae bacterium]